MTAVDNKQLNVAVMGLSGVGKTTLARKLPAETWFHYSVDYRIWTHYLGDEVSDYLKRFAKSHPVLDELLQTDSISVEPRVTFDNLHVTSVYMGMLGSPDEWGLDETEFARRMEMHAQAERGAMRDIPKFVQRSQELYGYPNFIADLSGSLCEVVEPDSANDEILSLLDTHCTLVYIRATDEHTAELIERGKAKPKPIYYRPDFLAAELPGLLSEFDVDNVTRLSPRTVGSHLYEKLLRHRVERYEAIAKKHAVTLEMEEVQQLNSEQDFVELMRSKKSA